MRWVESRRHEAGRGRGRGRGKCIQVFKELQVHDIDVHRFNTHNLCKHTRMSSVLALCSKPVCENGNVNIVCFVTYNSFLLGGCAWPQSFVLFSNPPTLTHTIT